MFFHLSQCGAKFSAQHAAKNVEFLLAIVPPRVQTHSFFPRVLLQESPTLWLSRPGLLTPNGGGGTYVICVYMQLYPASSLGADVLWYLKRFREQGKINCDECVAGSEGEEERGVWVWGVSVSSVGWVRSEGKEWGMGEGWGPRVGEVVSARERMLRGLGDLMQ